MNEIELQLGDTVIFQDEFGKPKTGTVVNLEPAGNAENGVSIRTNGRGEYIRLRSAVIKEVGSDGLEN